MNKRLRALLQLAFLIAVFLLLFFLFPRALAFAELAAREVRYLWWLILLVALAVWLIWGIRRERK